MPGSTLSHEENMRDPVYAEKKRRIWLAVCAYAYEIYDVSLVDDHTYDQLALEINLEQATDNPELDSWWKENFDPSTGMWVRKHPNTNGLHSIYESISQENK